MKIPHSRTRSRFDALTILLHWTTVTLVATQLTTGFAMAYAGNTATLARLLVVHRSLGASIFLLTFLRLVWRRNGAYLPPFPPHMPMIQQWAATANECALYALLFLQPLTGLGDTLFRAQPVTLFAWTIPALVPRVPMVFKLFHTGHEWGAEALVALIGLHAVAALIHQYVLRDRVLQRMLPSRRN